MSLLTVEGIYKDGKIELPELASSVGSPTRVIVTFLPTKTADVAEREEIRARVIAQMKEGIHFGGPPYPSREELHDAPDDDPRSLIDTNILVYTQDLDDPAKHAIAVALVDRLLARGRLVISGQVFNEFCSVMMRPGRPGRLSADQLSTILRNLHAISEVVPVTANMTFRALGAMRPHGLSFWDALIWAAAADNGVPVVYTEDFQAGREVEGVRFVNPFVGAGPTGP